MPSTGILFAVYVCCLGLWKSSWLPGVATAGSQGYLELLKMKLTG